MKRSPPRPPAMPTTGTPPLPLLIFHHGMGGDASQFCGEHFARQAEANGFALACTEAIGGGWHFPSDPHLCAADASLGFDVDYVATIISELSERPTIDAQRVFQIGFSQGALFAAYASFCLEAETVGFGQSGSSYAPAKLLVFPTSPPLRACLHPHPRAWRRGRRCAL